MPRTSTLMLAGAMLMAGAVAADAGDWSRSRTITGPYGGQRTFHSHGDCYGGACESRQVWTGPAGHSVTRDGRSHCSSGHCEREASWTDRLGRQWTTRRSVTRY